MRLVSFIFLLIFFTCEAFPQSVPQLVSKRRPRHEGGGFGVETRAKYWGLTHLSGEIKLRGQYRDQKMERISLEERQKTTRIGGGIRLSSGCYIWNPKFMLLDVDAQFNPESHKEKFIIIPDLGEVNTLAHLDIRTIFLNQKQINFGGNFGINESYSNRENLSDIRSKGRNYGGFLNYGNKYVSLSNTYYHNKWNQKEILTGRLYLITQSEYLSKIENSFSTWDKNEFRYTHSTHISERNDADKRRSICDNFVLIDNIHFDKKKKFKLYVLTSVMDRKLNNNYTRVRHNQNFFGELPENFHVKGQYAYNFTHQEENRLNQHNIEALIGHRLFKSLNSDVFVGYARNSHTQFHESDSKLGLDLHYMKSLPLKGRLSLSYNFTYRHKKRAGEPSVMNIYNEDHSLLDGQMVLLDNPDVDISSVIITDISGTIIYQPGFDYNLVSHQDNYIEVQRVPGGLIADGASVYVDYSVVKSRNYTYDSYNNGFSASVSLFQNLVEVYYTFSDQGYFRLIETDLLRLNTFGSHKCGLRLNYQFASCGVEYNSYNSNIVPYRATNVYLQFQGTFLRYFSGSLSGNMRYITLTDEDIKQNYSNLAGRLNYSITPNIRLGINASYLHQKVQGTNLDLTTAGLDFSTGFRQIYFTLGLQLYRRSYLGEKTNYNGGYVQVSRRF